MTKTECILAQLELLNSTMDQIMIAMVFDNQSSHATRIKAENLRAEFQHELNKIQAEFDKGEGFTKANSMVLCRRCNGTGLGISVQSKCIRCKGTGRQPDD